MNDLPPHVWISLGPEAPYGTKLGSKMSVSPPLGPSLISNPLAHPAPSLPNHYVSSPSIALP